VSANVSVGHSLDRWDAFTNGNQSEQIVVQTFGPSEERLFIAAYNDTTNQFKSDGTPTDPSGRFTQMGWSIMRWGEAWKPQDQFSIPSTAGSLRGDPWLATDETAGRVWYVSMTGDLSDPLSHNGFAITHSDQGGLPGTWDDPPYHWPMPIVIDKPSLAVSPPSPGEPQRLFLAYINQTASPQRVELIYSEDDGMSWSGPILVSDDTRPATNPIVRTSPVAPKSVYITYQAGIPTNSALRLAISNERGESFTDLGDFEPFVSVGDFNTDPAYPPDQGRNVMTHSFHIDPGNFDCQVVYESFNAIWFVSTNDGMTWSVPVQVHEPATGRHQFQPVIAGSEQRIAVTYYEQSAGGSDTEVWATYSDGHGVAGSWSAPQRLTRDGSGGPLTFQPCASDTQGGLNRYFGDYIGLVAAQRDEGGALANTFVALWADSRDGCESVVRFHTIHQHTMGATFW
jgi:hypothetical protein